MNALLTLENVYGTHQLQEVDNTESRNSLFKK